MTTPSLEDRMLGRDDTAILLIDVQDRLFATVGDKPARRHLAQMVLLLRAARIMSVPLAVTEQYPKGLGATVAELRPLVEGAPRASKVEFSCCRNTEAAAVIAGLERRKIVVLGMETHVCVYQTVLDLLAAGHAVHVVADGVLSRHKASWRIGLDLCAGAGAVVTSAEAVIFQLLGQAGGDVFKRVQALLK